MPSTRNLSELPDIESLRKRLQQMAALDAVFAIDFGTASYDFHPNWSRSQQLAVFKNGSGDELFLHFTQAGCGAFQAGLVIKIRLRASGIMES